MREFACFFGGIIVGLIIMGLAQYNQIIEYKQTIMKLKRRKDYYRNKYIERKNKNVR